MNLKYVYINILYGSVCTSTSTHKTVDNAHGICFLKHRSFCHLSRFEPTIFSPHSHEVFSMVKSSKQRSDQRLQHPASISRQGSSGSRDLFRDEYQSDSSNSADSRHFCSSSTDDEESTGGWSDTSGIDSEGDLIDTSVAKQTQTVVREMDNGIRRTTERPSKKKSGSTISSLVVPKAEPDAPFLIDDNNAILQLEEEEESDDDYNISTLGGSILGSDKKATAKGTPNGAIQMKVPVSPVRSRQSLKAQMSPVPDQRPASPFGGQSSLKASKSSPSRSVDAWRPPSPPTGTMPQSPTYESIPPAPILHSSSPVKKRTPSQAQNPSQYNAPRPVRFAPDTRVPLEDLSTSPRKDGSSDHLFEDRSSDGGSPQRLRAPYIDGNGEIMYDGSPGSSELSYCGSESGSQSRHHGNDRSYDNNSDRRFDPQDDSLPIFRAEYPDGDPESSFQNSGIESIDDSYFSSLGKKKNIHEEDEYRNDRGMMIMLIVCLSCSVLLLGMLGGGIIGALFLSRGDKDSPTPPLETSSPPTTMPSVFPSASPSTFPSSSPSSLPTTVPSSSPSSLPTAVPSSSPSNSPTFSPSEAPTAFVTNQELFDMIAQVSSDQGQAILQDLSPQNQAYAWLQNEDPLVNSDRRLRRLQLSLPRHRILQRYALMTFYFATNGPNWSRQEKWGSGENECDWHQDSLGSNICDFNSNLNVLEFSDEASDSNISGELPPEIGLLTTLSKFSLVNDETGGLTGQLPTEIGLLTSLNLVKLSKHADLNGSIPQQFFSGLRVVDHLDLSSNGLSGAIPTAIGTLAFATKVDLHGNSLDKKIPSEVGLLVNVRTFDLSDNSLTGNIPTRIGLMTSLTDLNLASNELNGNIPAEIGNLSNLKGVLDVSNNGLTGALPDFSNLVSLQKFVASNNALTGGIPASLSNLTDIRQFDVEFNNISGGVSEEVCAALTAIPTATSTMDCTAEINCPCCTTCCQDAVFGPAVCVNQ